MEFNTSKPPLIRAFGKTDLRFFVLGLGTIWFGRPWPPGNTTYRRPPDDEIARHLERAFQVLANGQGILMIDTAAAYGDAEERLGAFLKAHPGLASKAFIATKWGEEFNPQTGNYDADTIATLQAGQQAYYFKGSPNTTVLAPQQFR